MKKIIVAGLALLGTVTIFSCKKDYNCVCRLNDVVVYTQHYDDIARSDAEDRCDGDVSGGNVQWDCDVELD